MLLSVMFLFVAAALSDNNSKIHPVFVSSRLESKSSQGGGVVTTVGNI